MSDRAASIEEEMEQIQRRADQSCSAHARLRDRYRRYAALLDYGIIGTSRR
jgi:hypothetical protein